MALNIRCYYENHKLNSCISLQGRVLSWCCSRRYFNYTTQPNMQKKHCQHTCEKALSLLEKLICVYIFDLDQFWCIFVTHPGCRNEKNVGKPVAIFYISVGGNSYLLISNMN